MTDKNPAAYPTDEHNYDVAWKLMPESWSADFTNYGGRCNLPIFIGADEWIEYKKTGEFRSSALSICIGVLYTWSEPEKWCVSEEVDLDEYRYRVLVHFGHQTNTSDLHELLISSAAWVRWNCGCNPSQRVLGGAIGVDPDNPMVRYDYVLDTWSLIERLPTIDIAGACQSLASIVTGIDLSQLHARSGEAGQQNLNSVCYLYLASMLLLGDREEYSRCFKLFTEELMRAPGLISRLKSAEDKDVVTVDDLRIFTKATE